MAEDDSGQPALQSRLWWSPKGTPGPPTPQNAHKSNLEGRRHKADWEQPIWITTYHRYNMEGPAFGSFPIDVKRIAIFSSALEKVIRSTSLLKLSESLHHYRLDNRLLGIKRSWLSPVAAIVHIIFGNFSHAAILNLHWMHSRRPF